MRSRLIKGTDLEVSALCLGGNVFGWTADKEESFAILDEYHAAGGNFVDTADAYCSWVDGEGGQSETIIGEWHTSRGNRSEMVLATKVGQKPGRTGLAPDNIRRAADESLGRLQTDYIDVYYAHIDDASVPLAETLGALSELVQIGKVRAIGASNFSASRLEEALAISRSEGLVRFAIVQPEYNLMHRDYEVDLADVCVREGIDCAPYFGLAKGFLTGKYRVGESNDGGPRAAQAIAFLDERGVAVLSVLDEIAENRGVSQGAVALAWLSAKPTVVAPLASARTPAQLDEIIVMATIDLTSNEMARLDTASAT